MEAPNTLGSLNPFPKEVLMELEPIVNSRAIQPFVKIDLQIDAWPQEFFDRIFSHLSKLDLQAITLVNQAMNNSAIAAVNYNEPTSIKRFVQLLIPRLNIETFLEQRNFLTEISEKIIPQGFENLIVMKGYILDSKNQIINVIKKLDTQTSNNLAMQVVSPKFMEDIFELSKIERRIDQVKLIPDKDERVRVLKNISKALAKAGNFDGAITAAMSIPDEYERGDALQNISGFLTAVGKIDRAINVAMSITDKFLSMLALRYIYYQLRRIGNFDRAINVAVLIPNEHELQLALSDISKALTQAGNIEKAIDVAMLISDVYQKGWALEDISEALTKTGNFDGAIAAAMSIPGESLKELVLKDIPKLNS